MVRLKGTKAGDQLVFQRPQTVKGPVVGQPVQVVVVDIEPLFGIRAPAAPKGRMQNLPIFRRRCRFGNNHDRS